jgi:hypothetical protein
MPFKNEKEVAEKIKGADKLSARKLRQFMHVFNSCYEKNGEDSMCYAQAWSAVNKTACMPCVHVKAAHELERIAFDLRTVSPRVARSILREARFVKRGA